MEIATTRVGDHRLDLESRGIVRSVDDQRFCKDDVLEGQAVDADRSLEVSE